jgi:uncharacterized membrane protein YeaQ/YmgE (transglycosylase-associated protein family)
MVDWSYWGLTARPNYARRKLRLLGNVIIGIFGALIASMFFARFNFLSGILVKIIAAACGAIFSLVAVRLLRNERR